MILEAEIKERKEGQDLPEEGLTDDIFQLGVFAVWQGDKWFTGVLPCFILTINLISGRTRAFS